MLKGTESDKGSENSYELCQDYALSSEESQEGPVQSLSL